MYATFSKHSNPLCRAVDIDHAFQNALCFQANHLLLHQLDDSEGRVVVTKQLFSDGTRALGQLGQVEAMELGRKEHFQSLENRPSLIVETLPAGATLIAVTGMLLEVSPALTDRVASTVESAHLPTQPPQLAKLPIAFAFIEQKDERLVFGA